MNNDKVNQLLQDTTLSKQSREQLLKLHQIISSKEFSDIVDEDGNQYVNFVQEGGGVWGVALVGYLSALETFGIRFLRIAGTSAGAINTMLIAALGDRSRNKSQKIREILFHWKFADFMDGKSIVKRIANKLLKNPKYFLQIGLSILFLCLLIFIFPFIILFLKISPWWYFIPFLGFCLFGWTVFHYYNLFRKNNIGLNPGNVFEKTLQKTLDDFEMKNIADLNTQYNCSGTDLNLNYRSGNQNQYYDNALENLRRIRVEQLANLSLRKFDNFYENAVNNDIYRDNPFTLLRSDYTVITTDVNTKIKVELPKMAALYWTDDELKSTSPAKFVRASMAVPYFFEPMIKKIDRSKTHIIDAWKFWLNANPESVANEAVFIDGGSISNFPIDIFHESDIFHPRIPVFGVRLVDKKEIGKKRGSGSKKILNSPFSFLGSIFDTLRGYNDKTFLTKYTFYSNHSIQTVDCSPSNWLNFFMEDQEKKELYNRGFQAGLDFLERFDWDKYKYERMLVALKEKGILKQDETPNFG